MSATRLLDASLVEQLRGYLTLLRHDIELTAVLDDSEVSAQTWELLETVASLSDRVTVRRADPAPTDRVPSFTVGRRGDAPGRVCFAGLPLGHEFTSLVLALLNIGGHPSKAAPEHLSRIAAIETPMRFETFYSQSCQNCPDVVQALNLVAALNPNVTHTAIDGASFASEAERRSVLAVPAVFLDGEEFASGRLGLTEILDLLAGPASRPEDTTAHEPFDVLVVGGGPAGCAAAVYAARKGVRTGMLAERLGGQVKDTLGIENLVSVLRTEGPELASALEAHVRAYDVEILTGRRAVSVRRTGDAMFEVTTNTGATLNARTVVLAPGAAWRTLGVTGEQEYKNRGVTFCPHCDGPLFAGKDVAVVGGGNSGVEAAIDLAGIARHVTLLEFAPSLRADAVLQRALAALSNVTVCTSARTTEILGDGRRVTALRFEDLQTGLFHEIDLSGVFVQIGLTPNTDWLAGTLELTPKGEIEISASGQTSVDGVFAAGDATTTPYKQIVVALGSGATAALSAFDHLIRHRAPHEAQVPELTSV